MVPGASVSGLWFGHSEARYFQLGRVGADQVAEFVLADHKQSLNRSAHTAGQTLS